MVMSVRKIIWSFILFFIFPLMTRADSAYLTALSIEGYFLSPEFDKYNNSYSVAINEEDTSLNLNYTLEDSKATVDVVGNENLVDGQEIKINVQNNAETQTYIIYVNKNTPQTVGQIENTATELNIPQKMNMKLVIVGLVIIWIALAYIFKKIIFFK